MESRKRRWPRLPGGARAWPAGVSLALGSSGGCIIDDVDLAGKACPCADGWECDDVTQTCRRPGASTTGADETGTTTAGPTSSTTATASSSESSGTTGPPEGVFEVLGFAADWATPNAIHWTWTAQGAEEDFHAWEVHVATSAEALDSDDAMVFDGSVNPELDRFSLRNTMDVEPVTGTITDGLDEATEYYARLYVFDTGGGRSSSPNVAVRSTTAAPTAQAVIMADDAPEPGAIRQPDCFARTDEAPAAGTTHHFEVQLLCTANGLITCTEEVGAAPECWENVRLYALNIPINGLNQGDFPDAFLEVYVSVVPPEGVTGHGWWSEIGLEMSDQNRTYKGITIRADGQYRRYQLPLSQLGLTHETLGAMTEGVRVGSTWAHGSIIRIDEARVRW